MLKIDYDPLVANALMKAFPKYTLLKANARIGKYVKTLERLMRRAKINKTSKRSTKKNTYEFEARILWDKTGQLKRKQDTTKKSLHKWLIDLRVPLVINTNPNYRPSNELAKFKPTKYLKINDESLLDKLKKMTIQERMLFLDNPSIDDIDEIKDYLKDFHALSSQEQNNYYDLVQVDIESVKNYLKKLTDGQVFIEYFKQESDADHAEYILRIAQLNNGVLPQLKDKSDFGRTYYKNLSVQNVSKRVRKVFLGDSWEYDCKSCSASWKMSFAQEYYDSKKRRKKSFEELFWTMTHYLEHKSDFFDVVIDKTFRDQYPYSHDYKTKIIKEAMTAIGFGAKLTIGSYKSKDGDIKYSSLFEVFNKDMWLLQNFVNCTIVREYNDEQKILNKFILNKFATDHAWISEMEASWIKRKRKPYKASQKISWLFQHAETEMMDIVREQLKKLGNNVLANIHDAIVVRNKLSQSEIQEIENLVKVKTNVHFLLGETFYERCI